MKTLLLLPILLLLPSCTTDPASGEKSFLGVTSKSLSAEVKALSLQVAEAGTKAAAQAALNVARARLAEEQAKPIDPSQGIFTSLAKTEALKQLQALVTQAEAKLAAFSFSGKQPLNVQP